MGLFLCRFGIHSKKEYKDAFICERCGQLWWKKRITHSPKPSMSFSMSYSHSPSPSPEPEGEGR